MSKAFTKESHTSDDDGESAPAAALPAGGKNYITPAGYARLKAELLALIDTERPRVVEVVAWAASNGDRSENADYHYGKKRLREIDRRIRFLTQRLESAVVTDPSIHHGKEQVFFGATVTYADADDGAEHSVTILGIDEVDSSLPSSDQAQQVSWISPIAQALLRAQVGDCVSLRTPAGVRRVEVVHVAYPARAAR